MRVRPWKAKSPDKQGPVDACRLGPNLAAGEEPQLIVPAHAWQAAESLGDWTLVGCTVAPGFVFEGLTRTGRLGAVTRFETNCRWTRASSGNSQV